MLYENYWIQPVRGIQTLFGIVIFGLIAYILAVFQFDNVTKFMLFNGIWTGFIATPYLAIAPVHLPRVAHYIVVPVVEASTFVLLLVGLILLGIDLPSSGNCTSAGCKAALAAVIITAFECALFFLTTIRAVITGVRFHQTKDKPTTKGDTASHSTAAMESV
ncbi:hypothetical protein FE257_002032 [Aspergillus nanangensis]|uniref:MARVEL domain-containing protein n=1 Tax=Aspergillus nanangensis TaxID=2582783 RepID=A0AAD4GX22_ASPNN|nr:hypothetical protein FE257_002032 [Aspergillus nanangensis]